MLFVVIGMDTENAVERRKEVRPQHLEHAGTLGDRLIVGGPFLDPGTGEPAGSVYMFEAEDLAAAQAFVDADPYWTEGVFAEVSVKPWAATVGSWRPAD